MRTFSTTCVSLALLLVSTPAFADLSGGCRCDSGSLASIALALPVVAVGLLFSRRGPR